MRKSKPSLQGWILVLVVAGVVGALAATTGIAFGSESGNAPSYSTNAPDPVSAQVVRNGANNSSSGSTNDAEFQVCFDKQIQSVDSPTFVGALTLDGYGGYGNPGNTGGWYLGKDWSTSNGVENSPDQTLNLGGTFTTQTVGNNSTGLSGETYTQTGGYTYMAHAANNPSNPNCVNVTITPTGSNEPGIDLNSFTQVSVDERAAKGLSGLDTTPGTVGLDPAGTPEVTPRAGASTGPTLLSVVKSSASPDTLTYVFDYNLDPNNATPLDFCYVTSDGNEFCASSVTVSGNQVTATFGPSPGNYYGPASPNIVNDVYYVVYSQGVFTQTTEVPNPYTARGGTVASVPTLRSATPVPGVPGTYDLTYDQPIVVNPCYPYQFGGGTKHHLGHCDTRFPDAYFAAVLEDNSEIRLPAGATSRPSANPNMIRISFGSVTNFADYASKVVRIVDSYCAVVQQSGGGGGGPGNCSEVGEADVSTPPNMKEAFTDGPNLIGFSIDTSNSTATYTFDSQYGSLKKNNGGPNQDFGLLYADGSNSFDAGSYPSALTFTGPNQVTAQFNPSQIKNAVAGLIGTAHRGGRPSCATVPKAPCDGSFAVTDYQGKGNLSPLASGIGIASSSTTTTSTGTTTVTTSTTKTTTTTTGRRHHHHPRPLGRLLLVGTQLHIQNGQVFVTFKCDSPKACFGLYSITVRVKGAHHHTLTVVCTTSRFAKYRIGAHKTKTVSAPMERDCLAEIFRHRRHRSGGKLTTRPRTNQLGIIRRVTLIL